MSDSRSLLEVDRVQSGYGKLAVLHDVSLRCQENEIVAIVGPNGAGKTTLIRTIFRLLDATQGAVSFNGQDLARFSVTGLAELGMGVVPQEGNTFPDLTVEENVRLSASALRHRRGLPSVESMLERFPILGERRKQRASTLSGGERQILALASAMMSRPRMLALDEPSTGLAPAIVEQVVQEIAKVREAGTAILWVVEESPLQVLSHIDRVYLLQAGSIEGELPATDLLEDQTLQRVFFGSEAGAATGPSA